MRRCRAVALRRMRRYATNATTATLLQERRPLLPPLACVSHTKVSRVVATPFFQAAELDQGVSHCRPRGLARKVAVARPLTRVATQVPSEYRMKARLLG